MHPDEASEAQGMVVRTPASGSKRRDWYEWTDLFLKAALPLSLFFLSYVVTKSQRNEDAARSDREASSRAAAAAIERELNQAQIRADRATQLMSALASPRNLEREIALSVALSLKDEGLLSTELVAAVQEVYRTERGSPGSRVAELAARVLDSTYDATVPGILAQGPRHVGDGPGWLLVGSLSRTTGDWIARDFNGPSTIAPGTILQAGGDAVMYSRPGGVEEGQILGPDPRDRIRALVPGEGARVLQLDTLAGLGDTLLVWSEVMPQFSRRW